MFCTLAAEACTERKESIPLPLNSIILCCCFGGVSPVRTSLRHPALHGEPSSLYLSRTAFLRRITCKSSLPCCDSIVRKSCFRIKTLKQGMPFAAHGRGMYGLGAGIASYMCLPSFSSILRQGVKKVFRQPFLAMPRRSHHIDAL